MKTAKNLLAGLQNATRHLLDGNMPNLKEGFRRSAEKMRNDARSRPGDGGFAGASLPDFVPDLLRQLGVSASPYAAPGQAGHTHHAPDPADVTPGGQFLERHFSNAAGARDYKVYIPSGHDSRPLPVVVMLHGCTQDPDDFAAGTRMNRIAEEQRCLVVYPAQSRKANHSRCWNWFTPADQRRDGGEPSIIAGITREVIAKHNGDPQRVYVAGLSAGGAMALIMGETYPELYAAVGVHSGLPLGSAHDLPSAFAAMKGEGARRSAGTAGARPPQAIVFHGDRDTTVHPRNGEQVIAQVTSKTGGKKNSSAEPLMSDGQAPGGRRYTQTFHRDEQGNVVGEHWVLHGAGHAWSGGSANGSYTDPTGPDAGAEMMRFFATRSQALH